jgi:hypothetical protein
MGKAARNRAIRKAAGGNKSVARKMRKYASFMKKRGVKVKWL